MRRRIRGRAGRGLEARRRLQVLRRQAARGREVPRRPADDRRRRRLFGRRDLEEVCRDRVDDRLRRHRGARRRHGASIKFGKPMPEFTFASLLSGPASYIVPKHVYAGSDPAGNPANNAPVGTGPWKFKAWVHGSHFEYVRNDDYWRPGFPYMDRLVLRFVRDPGRTRGGDRSRARSRSACSIAIAAADIKRLTGTPKFVATTQGLRGGGVGDDDGMQLPQAAVRQARGAAGDVLRGQSRADRQDRLLRLCAAGHRPDLLAEHRVLHARHVQHRL